ncbi:MAG TPA: signal peptidase I [Allosphingosinicella sp.]|nr:signal peptidase I [Allosphingosinicella sp.]
MKTAFGRSARAAPAKGAGKDIWRMARFVGLLFLAALLLRSLIVTPFNIPSGSMLPRMMIGDYLLVAKWPYGYSRFSFPFGLAPFGGRIMGSLPERGDVVVFRYPGSDQDYVKRVIGLPGDTIALKGGQVILNGDPLPRHRIADFLMPRSPNSPCRFVDESRKREVTGESGETFCAYPRYREILPGGRSHEVIDQAAIAGDDSAPMLVPPHHLFVMGDNRDDSMDSRYSRAEQGVGMLPLENVVGRALVTFFSTDGSAELVKPWTWLSAARWDRIGKSY